jgi:ribose 5-phosphate isomerase A
MDSKKRAAESVIPYLKNKTTIGLGAGSTIAHVVEILKLNKKEFQAEFTTSSFNTLQLLKKYEFNVIPVNSLSSIEIYIDGCDQLDKNLTALKSGGGIHTLEKLLASMAKEFIIIGDVGKYVDQFDSRFPVTINVLPESLHFILEKLSILYPEGKIAPRLSDKKDGLVTTDQGNYLIDIWFQSWPELSGLHLTLKSMTGIIETSLFCGLVHKAILAGEDDIRIIEKAES